MLKLFVRRGAAAYVVLGLVLAFWPRAGGADPAPAEYKPVAPFTAIHASVLSQLKLVQDWLAEKDYPSAADAAVGLVTLVELFAYHGSDAGWRDKIAALRTASSSLGTSARKKDAAGCARLIKECERLLGELKEDTAGEAVREKSFKPFGASQTWMKLMDGSYADAKTSRNVQQVEQLAYTIAEVVNVVSYTRSEARWHDTALEVRELALEAAGKAKAGKLDDARADLKKAYQRCEYCHQGFKR